MKTLLLALAIAICSYSAISQQVETKYYKYLWDKTEVKEKKAKYKKLTYTYDDGKVVKEIYNLKAGSLFKS